MSDDLIRRSDAIEAIELVDWYHQNRNKDMVSGANSDEHQAWYKADDIYEALEAVPSADRPQGDSVSRQYLLAEIDDLADEFSEVDENGLHSERWCGILDSRGIIVNAPSVSDRLQGEWIRDRYWSRGVGMGEDYGFFYKCSLCEYEVENGYTRCGFNFCPYCGAKMKGADDE